jgi:FdhD protein
VAREPGGDAMTRVGAPTDPEDTSAVVRRRVRRWSVGHGDGEVEVDLDVVLDELAVEEPLELQVAAHASPPRSVAVVMRTPDDDDGDEELALGFLRTEGVIVSVDDVERVAPCPSPPSAEAAGNVLQVRLRAGVEVDWHRLTRHVFSASSCGVCGKATLDAVGGTLPGGAVAADVIVDAAVLHRLVTGLRERQPLFSRTGATHAAALARVDGEVLVVREDVGRHNALDKVLGAALRRRIPLGDVVAVVSGRVAFELVQKCAVAGVGLVAGVGAPTSLAVDLGARAGVGVVGFVGDDGFVVYCGEHRVSRSPVSPTRPPPTARR